MELRYAIVVTTINHPTAALCEMQRRAAELPAAVYVIGDSKSPRDFSLPGARYLDLDAQRATRFAFGQLCPTRHYARKNIGYLVAMRDGATVIVESDDDNFPLEGFWTQRQRAVTAPTVHDKGWCNVYRYFSNDLIWPRGLPLDEVKEGKSNPKANNISSSDCPIQQALANDNPDVDAIYRLLLPLPRTFVSQRQVVLGSGVWCPFNSQNTTWWRDAFPLLYLPFHCSFRMTDIWRSFVAQRIAWENDWRILFQSPTVYQDRNEHDLMQDFADEMPGYLHNERIRRKLEDIAFERGVEALSANMIKAYEALITMEVVGSDEAGLLRAWLSDVESVFQHAA